jgi:hypothetical protein
MHRFVIAGLVVVSVMASSSAFAAMDKAGRTKFVARCQASMYMSGAQCGCMADIADKKLDDLGIAYLSLDPLDVTNSAAMSKKMTGKELSAVDNFMKTAPHTCSGAK